MRRLIAQHGSSESAVELLALQTNVDKYDADAMKAINKRAAVISKFLALSGVPDVRFVSVPFVSTIITSLWCNSIGISDETELQSKHSVCMCVCVYVCMCVYR